MITEQQIRAAHKTGLAHGDDEDKMCFFDSVIEDRAYCLGRIGAKLGEVEEFERYGNVPNTGVSYNYRDDICEYGTSTINCDGDAGAQMFMSDRPIVKFRGIRVVGKVGSDGEVLALPVDIISE